MATTIKVGGQLESVAVDEKLVDAAQVKDTSRSEKSQKEINDKVEQNYTTLSGMISNKADKTALPSAATASTAGLTKLYTATGTNTDGAMTQKAATDALGNKLSLSGGTMTGNITMNGKSVVFATETSWTNQDREIPFASTNVGQITYYNNNSSKGLTYNPNTGALKAGSFVKRGGTSSQFLKADGSVDGNSYSTTSHTHQSLLAGDTRNVTTNPSDYMSTTAKGLTCVGLKNKSLLGISSGGYGYVNLFGLAPWNDNSAGDAHELAFDAYNGNIWHRHGNSTWSDWVKLAHTDDIPTKVSALTNDAGYLTTHQDISGKVNKSDVESTITSTSTNPVTSKAISDALDDKLDTSKVITSTGQTPTTDTVFSSKIINDKVEANYTTLSGMIANKADKTALPSAATASTAGLTKLYTATGTATDGAMTQKAATDALGNKLSLSGGTMTGNITMNGKSVVFATDTEWTNQDREIPFASTNVGQITYYNNNSSKGLTYNPNTGALKAGSFVKRGGTSSQFLKADGSVDSNTYLTTHQDISGKVDKVDGKGLSTNDYTTTEKEKLAAIEAAANRTIVDSAISSTSTNPVTSKAISTALASKVDTVSGKGLSTNDYTTAEKTKLAGIAEGATKTTVDTALSTTSTNPVQNKVIAEALDNKADKGSQINLALTGTVDGYYAAASSIPSTVTAGTFACDQGSGTTKRCLTIVANGTIVNDVAAADGAIYLDKNNGHVYIAASGNKNAWVDGGQIKGDKGDKGADGKDGKDGVDGAQTVVQTTGTSTTDVMSQIAVSQELLKQEYSFLYKNADYSGANTSSYMQSARTGAITSTKYPTLTEYVLDINLKAVYAEGTYCICGGRTGSSNIVNLLLVKNGKLAYCNSYNISNATETDYTFDDDYHHIISVWGATYQRIYVDGELIVNTTVTTARSLYIGYNGLYFMSYMTNGGNDYAAPADVHVKGIACLYINGELACMFLGRWLSSMNAQPYLWSSISGVKTFDKDNYDNTQCVLEKACKETNLIAQNTLKMMPPHTTMSVNNRIYIITLSQEQADRINATPVISIKFCELHNDTQPRYMGIKVPSTNENKITVGDYTYYTGINIVHGYNQFGYFFQSNSTTQPSEGGTTSDVIYSVNTGKDYIACLWFTLNRVTGEAFIYDENFNQIGYYQHESMKYDKFITSNNQLYLRTGEGTKRLLEVAIYDGYINTSGMSGVLQQTITFSNKSQWSNISNALICSDRYNTWTPNDDGYEHMSFSANQWRIVIEMGHYGDGIPQWMRKKIEILSGTITFGSGMYGYGTGTKWAFDADGNSVLGQTVGAGVYDIYMSGSKYSAYPVATVEAGEMRVLESTVAPSCELFRIENFAVLDGCMWDAAAQRLVEVSIDDNLIFNNLEATSTSSMALYIGQKRSYNGNLYMVDSNYTWKQINNA